MPRDPRVWWAVVKKTGKDPLPCIAGRTRESARELKEPDERIVKLRIVKVTYE